jgi:protein gp37
MQRSTIEWTDYTSNPLRARCLTSGKRGHHCVKVSAECDHCYAEGWNKHYGTGMPFAKEAQDEVEMFVDEKELGALQRLNQRSQTAGWQPYVFVCDMTDLFQQAVTDAQLDRLFEVWEGCTSLRLQVLTKRPIRMSKYLGKRWAAGAPAHIQLGVSAGQPDSLWRIEYLLATPAALRFLSCEPMLAQVNLHPFLKHRFNLEPHGHLDWVIFGGESGQGCRPTSLDHLHDGVQQCFDTDTPVFVKQLGGKPVYHDEATDDIVKFPIKDKKGGDRTDFPCHFVRQMPDGTER